MWSLTTKNGTPGLFIAVNTSILYVLKSIHRMKFVWHLFFWFIMLFCLFLIVLYCCILLYFFGCHCRKSFHCCNSDNSTTSCNGDGMLLDHNSIIDIIIQICFIIIFLPFFHLVVEAPMRLSFFTIIIMWFYYSSLPSWQKYNETLLWMGICSC